MSCFWMLSLVLLSQLWCDSLEARSTVLEYASPPWHTPPLSQVYPSPPAPPPCNTTPPPPPPVYSSPPKSAPPPCNLAPAPPVIYSSPPPPCNTAPPPSPPVHSPLPPPPPCNSPPPHSTPAPPTPVYSSPPPPSPVYSSPPPPRNSPPPPPPPCNSSPAAPPSPVYSSPPPPRTCTPPLISSPPPPKSSPPPPKTSPPPANAYTSPPPPPKSSPPPPKTSPPPAKAYTSPPPPPCDSKPTSSPPPCHHGAATPPPCNGCDGGCDHTTPCKECDGDSNGKRTMLNGDGMKSDSRILSEILTAELLLSDQYSRAGKLGDEMLETLTSSFHSNLKWHIRALRGMLRDTTAKPRVDASKAVFAKIINAAVGKELRPDFDAYSTGTNFLLAASLTAPLASGLSIAGLPQLHGADAQKAVAGISSSLAAQASVFDILLKTRRQDIVKPYNVTVGELSSQLQDLRKTLQVLHRRQAAAAKSSSALSSSSKTAASSKAEASFSSGRAADQRPEEMVSVLTQLGFYGPGQQ